MSKSQKIDELLVEIDRSLANYQQQLTWLQVEIFKLELKKEKLRDKIIFQCVKDQIATRA